MKDLRITTETIKVLKQNIDGKLLDIGIDAQCRGNKSKLNKWKDIVKVLVAQSYSTLCDPMDCSLPGSPVYGDSPDKNAGVGSIFYSRGSSSRG